MEGVYQPFYSFFDERIMLFRGIQRLCQAEVSRVGFWILPIRAHSNSLRSRGNIIRLYPDHQSCRKRSTSDIWLF